MSEEADSIYENGGGAEREAGRHIRRFVPTAKRPLAGAVPLIPADKLPGMMGKMVHVVGWARGCVFRYCGTADGRHKLVTPKTKRVFLTTSALYYTNQNKPKDS